MEEDLFIRPGLIVPMGELTFTTSRSSGPGGQHVNKTSTRVTLIFDVDSSPTLTPEQKDRLKERLAGRISSEGLLRVNAGRERSQMANRQAATNRFAELLRMALEEDRARIATKPSPLARERRLADKRRRSRLKRDRGDSYEAED